MTLLEAIVARHSVRKFTLQPIEAAKADELRRLIDDCNRQSGLHMQLALDEPDAFDSRMAHYGKFENVRNYVALVGPKGRRGEQTCGYWGEQVVLRAQQLGLRTCWVALTYSKRKTLCQVQNGERLHVVIALGYGAEEGRQHKSKPLEAVSSCQGPMPEWFKNGIEAALLAPTAMNQQRFSFATDGSQVSAKSGLGFYTHIDLGIAKCHFEIGAGRENFDWR